MKRTFAMLASAGAGFAPALAWAHGSLVPHAHPHEETALLGLDAAIAATLAVIVLAGLAAVAWRDKQAARVRTERTKASERRHDPR